MLTLHLKRSIMEIWELVLILDLDLWIVLLYSMIVISVPSVIANGELRLKIVLLVHSQMELKEKCWFLISLKTLLNVQTALKSAIQIRSRMTFHITQHLTLLLDLLLKIQACQNQLMSWFQSFTSVIKIFTTGTKRETAISLLKSNNSLTRIQFYYLMNMF